VVHEKGLWLKSMKEKGEAKVKEKAYEYFYIGITI